MNKSYEGKMMDDGKANEEVIFEWLIKNYNKVVDLRDIEKFQKLDIDFAVLKDGVKTLIETKSDKWISKQGNLFFEFMRIRNSGTWFYLGWGYRSKANLLLVRNPKSDIIFQFDFEVLRKYVSGYIREYGKFVRVEPIKTDDFETTFGFLVPMDYLQAIYKIWNT